MESVKLADRSIQKREADKDKGQVGAEDLERRLAAFVRIDSKCSDERKHEKAEHDHSSSDPGQEN
jgi:hypothetical protein